MLIKEIIAGKELRKNMFLPGKYVHPERTLVSIGAKVIYLLQRPQNVSRLWNSYKQLQEDEQLPVVSFDVFVNALCFLYAVNAIEMRNNTIRRIEHAEKNL
ncbi:ABC-three component system middle component 6 [Sporosarcina psychrophila]|uniref:ABC-three component system middle component 6 n=1 Tax=Sporosarcina psychrophila TaxID=1476 RepID=UPI0030CF08DB